MEAYLDLQHLDHTSGYWRTERKTGWEVTFSMRRTAEGRGFGRASFTFSPSYLGTILRGSVFWVFWLLWVLVLLLVVGLWYPGFLQSLHVLFTYKRISDRQGFVLDRLARKKTKSFQRHFRNFVVF